MTNAREIHAFCGSSELQVLVEADRESGSVRWLEKVSGATGVTDDSKGALDDYGVLLAVAIELRLDPTEVKVPAAPVRELVQRVCRDLEMTAEDIASIAQVPLSVAFRLVAAVDELLPLLNAAPVMRALSGIETEGAAGIAGDKVVPLVPSGKAVRAVRALALRGFSPRDISARAKVPLAVVEDLASSAPRGVVYAWVDKRLNAASELARRASVRRHPASDADRGASYFSAKASPGQS